MLREETVWVSILCHLRGRLHVWLHTELGLVDSYGCVLRCFGRRQDQAHHQFAAVFGMGQWEKLGIALVVDTCFDRHSHCYAFARLEFRLLCD